MFYSEHYRVGLATYDEKIAVFLSVQIVYI